MSVPYVDIFTSMSKEKVRMYTHSKDLTNICITKSHLRYLRQEFLCISLQDWQKFLLDGVHLSRLGSEHLEAQLWPILDHLTKDLPMKLPVWSEIDNNNPQELLLK